MEHICKVDPTSSQKLVYTSEAISTEISPH